jgi:hypothetical protein
MFDELSGLVSAMVGGFEETHPTTVLVLPVTIKFKSITFNFSATTFKTALLSSH